MASLEISRDRESLLCGDVPVTSDTVLRHLFPGLRRTLLRGQRRPMIPAQASSQPSLDPQDAQPTAESAEPGIDAGLAEARRASPRSDPAATDELRSLLEGAPGYMAIVHGAEHVLELASPACRRLAGSKPLAGHKVRDVLPESCGKQILDILDRAFSSGKAVVEKELCLTFPDGPGTVVRYLDFECQPIRGRDGTVTGLFVQARDVTTQVAVIRSLHEAAQQKDDFLALLAHELRNPLAPIMNVSSILRHLPAQGDTLDRLADTLARQARHMRRLIDDLIDASRARRGLLQLNLVEVDVREVIEAAVEQTAPPMKARGHVLSVQLADSPMWVLGDSMRLVQVISNVLHNAAKYTPPGGKVTLQAAPQGEQLEITVSDNGIGMDAEFLVHVFEPFVQARRSPERADSGLGLGLALVHSLVELHGGTVQATSAGIGLGSAFTVRLPLLKQRGDSGQPAS